MRLGDVLYESGGMLQNVYFPTTAILSLHYVMENGSSSKLRAWATKACSAFRFSWAETRRPAGLVVQTGGQGYRLKAQLMLQEFNRAGLMQRLMLRYYPGADHANVADSRLATGTIPWCSNEPLAVADAGSHADEMS